MSGQCNAHQSAVLHVHLVAHHTACPAAAPLLLPLLPCSTIITAFKAVPSSDVSQSRKLQAAKPKAVSTGMYTEWWYDGITNAIGTRVAANGVTSKAECFDACDAQDNCAGVVYQKGDDTCLLITGAAAPDGANAAKRTLTRALPSNFAR